MVAYAVQFTVMVMRNIDGVLAGLGPMRLVRRSARRMFCEGFVTSFNPIDLLVIGFTTSVLSLSIHELTDPAAISN